MSMMQLLLAGGGSVVDFTFVTSATASTATIVIPATAAIGDVAILLDRAQATTAAAPAAVTPTGFTQQNTAANATATGLRISSNYKILVAGDPGATITGMTGTASQTKILLIFRPDTPITNVILGGGRNQALAAAGVTQTLALAGEYQRQGGVLAIAQWGGTGAITTRGFTGITMTEVAGATTSHYAKYAILNPLDAALTNGTQTATTTTVHGEECFWLQGYSATAQYPIVYYNGSALTGWTTAGTVLPVSAAVGTSLNNSFTVNGLAGTYAYINTGLSLLNKTIFVDIYCPGTTSNALCNFFFACSAAGLGNMYRHECRTASPGGLSSTTSWTVWTAPTGATPTGTPLVWASIKIQISAAGVATYYINGTVGAINNTFTINNQGGYIGCIGDGGGNGLNRFDNIRIYDGII